MILPSPANECGNFVLLIWLRFGPSLGGRLLTSTRYLAAGGIAATLVSVQAANAQESQDQFGATALPIRARDVR